MGYLAYIIFFEGLKQSQYSCTPAVINRTAFTNITVGGKSEAGKIDFFLMSFTLPELRYQALPGFNATRESRMFTFFLSDQYLNYNRSISLELYRLVFHLPQKFILKTKLMCP